MKKRDEAAAEEAKLALEDFESLSKQLDGSSRDENTKVGPSSGRMVFNAAGTQAQKSSKTKSDDRTKADRFYDDSDSENDVEAEDNNDDEDIARNDMQKDVNIDPNLFHEVSDVHQDGLLKVKSFIVFSSF